MLRTEKRKGPEASAARPSGLILGPVADVQASLTGALAAFLDDAVSLRNSLIDDGKSIHPPPDTKAFATRLAALPSASAVDRATMDVAKENAYLLPRPGKQADRRQAGRALSATALVETGTAGLLLSGEVVDGSALVAQLAAYLAGPPVPVWNYAITSDDISLSAPVPVVDDWELVTLSREERSNLVGVPAAAKHVLWRSFRHDIYGGLAMLRRIDPHGRAHSGIVIYWERPAWELWQPLLAMSLYQNAVLHLLAQYEVEPGRRVDVIFDRVYTEPWTPDGVTEVEVTRPGDYEIDASSEARFRRFLELLAPLLATALAQPRKPTKASKKRAARLRRIAEHFVTAGEEAYGEGEVLSELNAEAVLHYVIALEAVLTGGEDEKTELTRKVVQRAAILAGKDDQDRAAVAATVLAAYRARSNYAHGGEAGNIGLPALRRVVRDCILARLILGDPVADDCTLGKLADAALLDHTLLAGQLRRRIDEFWAAVDSP